jgi:hypothetical protein
VKDGAYMKRFREAMQFFYQKHFRRSPQFDMLMKIGAFFFAIAKKNKTAPLYTPQHFVLVSENERLREALQEKLGKTITRTIKLENVLSLKNKKAEIVFDNEYVSYKESIAFMEQQKNSGFTFKMRPAGALFIIGSNSCNDRGEVITVGDL